MMTHRILAAVALAAIVHASPLSAQSVPDLNAPKRAAEKAVNAENTRLSAQTGQAIPDRRGSQPSAPVSGPGSVVRQAGTQADGALAQPVNAMSGVSREVFAYESEGRRDPFYSLILTDELRPLLSDLKLVGVLYAAATGRSVAIMRDILTNVQYRVSSGATLGRMRVAQIKPRAVIFTIDEFGVSRTDSLFLVDSTKVRSR
jgi:hypothetical protein